MISSKENAFKETVHLVRWKKGGRRMIWIWITIAVVSTIIIAVLAVRSRGQQQTWEERALDQRIALRLQQKEEEQQPMHTLSGDELRRALGRRYTLLMQESTIFIQIVEFEEQEDAR